MARPIGVVAVAFGHEPLDRATARAAELGFDHIDAHIDAIAALEGTALPIPIADRISGFDVADGCTIVVDHTDDAGLSLTWTAPQEQHENTAARAA